MVHGMVFNREPEGVLAIIPFLSPNMLSGVVKKVLKGKVAVFTSGVDIAQTETKGTVLLKNAEEMLNFTSGEEKHLEKVQPLNLAFDTTNYFRRSSKSWMMLVSKSSLLEHKSENLHCTISTAWASLSSRSSPSLSSEGCVAW